MNRAGTKEWKVHRVNGEVFLRMNEETAAGLALILESFEDRQMKHSEPVVTWGDLVADLRTAR